MASIFKKRILKERLEKFEVPNFENKLAIIQKWLTAYRDGHLQKKTESETEQAFNQDIFIEILGFNAFPDNPHTIIPKGRTMTSAQKPDAILGHFTNEDDTEKVAAVCEIKDANTSLDKSQKREGSLTPVQQAFKYRTQYKSCDFVIATNFFEIRLLKENELHYEQWTLESLADPKNDYFEFKKFYYLLCSQHLVVSRGKSKTTQLLSEIQIEQEKITKEFYKLYKGLREKLIRNIFDNNEDARQKSNFYHLAVEKAQKIIDRLIFVAFCEDIGLLPENILMKVIESDNQTYGSTWNTLKGFFNAVDVGSKRLGNADGYNGELFKPDKELDSLEIDDKICREFLEIGKYDFEDDLTVNILGHIFEQSISDLEELKAIGEEKEPDKKTSKRKKDGIFYTPEYIVSYIVQNSVGAWLKEKEKEMLKKHKAEKVRSDIKDKNYDKRLHAAYEEYATILQNIKVLDPACGSGAFLVKVFDYLLEENKRISKILEKEQKGATTLFDTSQVFKDILQNNIYGVDLNPESVEITKLSLWLKTAQKGKKLANLHNNIKCGNSIVDDPEFAGKSAFKWETEFKEIMKDGGFDIIIGNPPYVRQEHIKALHKHLECKYKSHSGKSDLYVYFFELGCNNLKENGYLGYISSGKFLEAQYGKPLCKFLASKMEFKHIINFGDLEVFKGVSAYPLIYIAQKKHPRKNSQFFYKEITEIDHFYNNNSSHKDELCLMSDFTTNDYKILPERIAKILKKARENSLKFSELYPLPTVGIKTGYNEGYLSKAGSDYVFGKNIKRYQPVIPKNKIIYPYKWASDHYEILPESSLPIELQTHKEKLSKRAIIKDGLTSGNKTWYEFQQINKLLNFEKEHIIYPNVSLGPNFTLSKQAIIDMTAFIIPSNSKSLLAILNSKLFDFFMKCNAISRRGGYNEYKVQYIKNFPVKNLDKNISTLLEKKVIEIMHIKKNYSHTKDMFQKLVSNEYNIKQWPRNLNDFCNLEFKEFTTKMKLEKLPLTQKDELLQLWNKYVLTLKELKIEAQNVDQEIDETVFDLYELTPEERQIVLNNTST